MVIPRGGNRGAGHVAGQAHLHSCGPGSFQGGPTSIIAAYKNSREDENAFLHKMVVAVTKGCVAYTIKADLYHSPQFFNMVLMLRSWQPNTTQPLV